MTQLQTLVQFMDALLEPSRYRESSYNGLQIDAGNHEIKTVAYSVDTGLSIIERAIKEQADLLITHHGLYWGAPNQIITGIHGKKVSSLIRAGVSLYSSHLPLDGNLEVGNAAEMLRLLECTHIEGFGTYEGTKIGAKGKFTRPVTLDEITGKLQELYGTAPFILPFGKKTFHTVGIATGSGSFAMSECVELGIDLFISGEEKQSNYHEAKELGLTAIFAGHYATETHGVRALATRLASQFGVKTVFIDEPTGI